MKSRPDLNVQDLSLCLPLESSKNIGKTKTLASVLYFLTLFVPERGGGGGPDISIDGRDDKKANERRRKKKKEGRKT